MRHLLGGLTEGVGDDQLPAVAFAQHYADTRGHPDAAAWQSLVDAYGESEALGVLATVRTIMWGNAVGIPLSSLRARASGSADPGTVCVSRSPRSWGRWPSALSPSLTGCCRGIVQQPCDAGRSEAGHGEVRPDLERMARRLAAGSSRSFTRQRQLRSTASEDGS